MFDTLPVALTAADGALYAAILAAAVAIVNSAVGRKREDENRRREMYSNAYRAALEWCEAVYRVRRRKPDGSQDYELVERFHELQERIAFYEGWLCTESEDLGRCYGEFRRSVMTECEPLLQDAWSRAGRRPTDPTPDAEKHPDVSQAKADFAQAVRTHMAPWWNPPGSPYLN
jgi:hypothetical protein